MVGKLIYGCWAGEGYIGPARRAAMTLQEGLATSGSGAVARQLHDKAYFLDLLGDGHSGLGQPNAAIDAYLQAADGYKAQGAHCSYALCLFKVADSHLSLGEPWHALGYLEACVPLLHDLGLTRHEALASEQLDACRARLDAAHLLGEGRAGLGPWEPGRPARPSGPASSRNTVAVTTRPG